ncbi:MAG: hypothetical protein ABI670_06015 [Chloroflexota bacterium]
MADRLDDGVEAVPEPGTLPQSAGRRRYSRRFTTASAVKFMQAQWK